MINLDRFKSGVLNLILQTTGEFIDAKLGENAAETIAWVITGILGIIALGLLIRMGVVFGKMATESDLNEKKKLKKQAINILLLAIGVLILTGSAGPLFRAIPLDGFDAGASPVAQNTDHFIQLVNTQLSLV